MISRPVKDTSTEHSKGKIYSWRKKNISVLRNKKLEQSTQSTQRPAQIDHFFDILKSNLAPRLGGIKQKKLQRG